MLWYACTSIFFVLCWLGFSGRVSLNLSKTPEESARAIPNSLLWISGTVLVVGGILVGVGARGIQAKSYDGFGGLTDPFDIIAPVTTICGLFNLVLVSCQEVRKLEASHLFSLFAPKYRPSRYHLPPLSVDCWLWVSQLPMGASQFSSFAIIHCCMPYITHHIVIFDHRGMIAMSSCGWARKTLPQSGSTSRGHWKQSLLEAPSPAKPFC